MSRSLSDAAVVRELAEQICRRLTRRMIATLQKMNNGLLSGDDSGLKNAWDEICAQLQFEESFSWDVYDETVRGLAASDIERCYPTSGKPFGCKHLRLTIGTVKMNRSGAPTQLQTTRLSSTCLTTMSTARPATGATDESGLTWIAAAATEFGPVTGALRRDIGSSLAANQIPSTPEARRKSC